MAAGVQKDVDHAGFVADQNHRFLTHPRAEEIARIGDLAFMADKQPGAGENRLKLLAIDFLADESAAIQNAFVQICHAGGVEYLVHS